MNPNRLNKILSISIISIVCNLCLSIGKIFVGLFINSQTIVSDGVHSASDVLTTVIVIIGSVIANKEEDKDHPYGHERFEEIASLLLGCFLAFTGFEIARSAFIAMAQEDFSIDVGHLTFGFLVCVATIILQFALFVIAYIQSKKINCSSLKADAFHHLSDSLSSIGALVGLVFVKMGYYFADSLVAIVISLFIFKTALDVIVDAVGKLTDKACPECEEQKIRSKIEEENVIIDVLKTRKFSNRVYIDVEISLDGNMSLYDAHTIAEKIHLLIEDEFPSVKHCMVHVNPN